MRGAFGWLSERSAKKNFMPAELSRNQLIVHFDVIPQHDWPIEQCLLHIRVFFGGKRKSPCFNLFIHWLIKQVTNTYTETFFKVIRKSVYLQKQLASCDTALIRNQNRKKNLLLTFCL